MTKVNRLVLHGFKSFARRTEIQFSDKFNVVLGPNGSGKSNILDALTFVLGKSSSKALRAEKSANLIYNGGKKNDPSKQAEVSIFFDNSNMDFPSEEKEIKISRIVMKSGQSKYKINDKPRTRQQIIDLMGIAKINPDGYNIILQGDIINFCNMTTNSRREIVEEISGIAAYEDKKNKALKDLEKVENNIKEADIVLNERKNYLKELKKDRDQALKYKEMSSAIESNRATLLDLQIKKKKEDNKKVSKQMEELRKSIDKYEEEIKKLREENEKKKEEISSINKEIEEKGEKEQVQINRDVEKLKIEITKNNSRMDHLQSELVKIDKREKDLKLSLDDINSRKSDEEKRKKELGEQRKTKKNQKEELDKKIEEFRKKHNLDQAGDMDKEIDELDKEIEEKQREMVELREKQQEKIRKKDNLEYQISTIDEKIKKVKEIEAEHKDELDKVKSKREEFKNTTMKLNELLNEDSKTSSQLTQARKDLVERNEELASLNLKANAVEHSINADIAMKRILELKEKMRGIHDSVVNLGDVSKKYSAALEIAAGARIKSVVVEDDKVAAECIKYLKNNKLGIVNFLPLNKIRGPARKKEIEDLEKKEGVVGFADNLIEYDPKFKNVFSYVFGNTLVVNDINTARGVGIGKCKMVTLDGDYCDVSGAMQGGFRKRSKQSMGFKDNEAKKKAQKVEEDVAEISNKILVFENKKAELEDEILKLRKFKGELEGDIIKAERSLHVGEGDIESSKQNKKELEEELKKVDKELEEAQSGISSRNSKLAQMKIKRQEIKGKVNELRAPTLIAELNTFNQKRDELNQEIIRLDSEISSVEKQIESMFETEKKNIDKLMVQLSEEKDESKQEIEKIEKENKIKNEELKKKEEHAKKFYAKFKEMFNKRDKLNSEINSNDMKINTKQQKSREHEIKSNTLSMNNAKLSAELAGLEQEFEQYKDAKLLQEKDEEKLKREIYKFEKMKEEIGSVNMKSLEMYDKIEGEYNKLLEKKDTLDKERQDVLNMIEEIDSKKKELFMENFEVINKNFKEIFAQLSAKGTAYMELENPEDPFEGGVLIKVKISGDKFLDIKSLSGGEKTMTALAFIFAIQEHDPAEFYIMDEVDAALDKKNSEKLSELIKQYCNKAQYIVISHNDGVISKADTLFGISMNENGISKATSLKV